MPKILIIGNESYDIPNEGEGGNWGQSVSDYLEAVSRALQTVQQPNDVPVTTASILNNTPTPTPILGFSFNTSEVIAINGEYIVRRFTDTSTVVQNGIIEGNFDGQNWTITHERVGNAGVVFDITSDGQIVYTSTNLTGANYDGSITFKAKVFNQDS